MSQRDPTQEQDGGGRQPTCDADFELVTVFRGSQVEALALRGLLESQGFHGHVAAQFTQPLMMTGGNVFEVELQVPRYEAVEALECLAACREEAARSPAEAAHANADDDLDPVPGRAPAAVLGRRLRWALALILALMPISVLSPFAGLVVLVLYWVFGIEYFRRVRREGAPPVGHGMTIACLVFATLFFSAIWAMIITSQLLDTD